MGRKKIELARDQLERLYLQEKCSPHEIGRLYRCNRLTVINRMREYCIPIRTKSQGTALAMIQTPRKSFRGDPIEKAYLVGLRVGDLTVDLINRGGQTIRVSCASTRTEQIELILDLFEQYGRIVINGPYANGRIFIQCLLDLSFEFLIRKSDSMPEWIGNDELFVSFLAGYVDAEGCIGIHSGKPVLVLATADRNLLAQIYDGLTQLGITSLAPRLWLKGGYTNRAGVTTRRDMWRLGLYRAKSVKKVLLMLLPLLRHRKRRADAIKVLKFLGIDAR